MKINAKTIPCKPHPLQYTGVPWVILKPSKEYKISRSSSVARTNHSIEPPLLSFPSNKGSQSSQTTQRSTQSIRNRFSFLGNTSIDFNEDELLTLNESLDRGPQTQLSINSPSRLQRIKLSRFEGAQKPLALDVNPSEPFIVSTAPDNIPVDLERDSSLISINCEEDLTDQIQMKSSLTSAAPTQADLSEMSRVASLSSRHQPVSMKEVQNQIWLYCHSSECQKPNQTIKPQLINAKIEDKARKVVINQPPGRKRLINAIHQVAEESKADYVEKVPEMKINEPLEKIFIARRFSRYLKDKLIDPPNYLSPSETYL